ncbi:hypothetical protein RSP816_05980 [Ralstonia solanacearum]|nr:hypothetical protein RSP816_05980 [Ralstonia solanacearum]
MPAPPHNAVIGSPDADDDNVSGSPQRRAVHVGLMAKCLAIGCVRRRQPSPSARRDGCLPRQR